MEYKPREEKELRSAMLLQPGEYDFEVIVAKEGVSKSNNDMIALELRIFCSDGTTRQVRDWLVPGSDMGDLKLNRFSHATGLEGLYFEGGLSGMACLGAVGKCKLTIQADPQYGDQNRVRDYIVAKAEEEGAVELRPTGVPAEQTKRALTAAHEREAITSTTDPEIPF